MQSAAALVRDGIAVSLAHTVPQEAAADVNETGLFYRTTNRIGPTGTSDTYRVSYHGLTVAHMDTWCHSFFDGEMYNGIAVADNVTEEEGCKEGSVMNWRDGVTTRAVLYDIPQLKGVEWIEPGTPITRADLEAWEEQSGVRAGLETWWSSTSGVGRGGSKWELGAVRCPDTMPTPSPGSGNASQLSSPTISTLMGLRDPMGRGTGHSRRPDPRSGAALDGDQHPGVPRPGTRRPDSHRARSIRVFMITWAPLPMEGGSGSPVNPLAIF